MSQVPSYLRAQCKALKGAQFAFISRAVVWCAQTMAAADDGAMPKASVMARLVTAEYPELAEKTVSNYLGTAQALAAAHKGIIRALLAGTGTDDWPATAALYVAHLVKSLSDGGYTQSEPDMRALSTGADSQKTKAAKLAEQQRKDTEAAAAAAAAAKLGETKPEPAPVEDTAPEGAKPEPAPGETREALAAEPVAQAPALGPVEPAKPAPVEMYRVSRDHTGALVFAVNADMSPGEMLSAMLHLEMIRADLLAALTPTVPSIEPDQRIEPEPVKAKTRKTKPEPATV